jgi:hypothetical protein
MSTWFIDGIKRIRNDDIVIGYEVSLSMTAFLRLFCHRFVGLAGAGKSHVRKNDSDSKLDDRDSLDGSL